MATIALSWPTSESDEAVAQVLQRLREEDATQGRVGVWA